MHTDVKARRYRHRPDLEGAMEWELITAAVLYLAFVALIIWWFWHWMR